MAPGRLRPQRHLPRRHRQPHLHRTKYASRTGSPPNESIPCHRMGPGDLPWLELGCWSSKTRTALIAKPAPLDILSSIMHRWAVWIAVFSAFALGAASPAAEDSHAVRRADGGFDYYDFSWT